MKIFRAEQLKLFEDTPGVSATTRRILEKTLQNGDAISLLSLSEEVAEVVKCNRDKIVNQVRQAVERLKTFKLITIPTKEGRRTFVARIGVD